MKIYTKFGDSGETALYGGTRLGKDEPRIEAIGTVDELNAYIGYAQTLIEDADLSELMARIQNHLFDVGADLATPATHPKAAEFRIPADFTTQMESAIDTLSAEPSRADELYFARWLHCWCYFTYYTRGVPAK